MLSHTGLRAYCYSIQLVADFGMNARRVICNCWCIVPSFATSQLCIKTRRTARVVSRQRYGAQLLFDVVLWLNFILLKHIESYEHTFLKMEPNLAIKSRLLCEVACLLDAFPVSRRDLLFWLRWCRHTSGITSGFDTPKRKRPRTKYTSASTRSSCSSMPNPSSCTIKSSHPLRGNTIVPF